MSPTELQENWLDNPNTRMNEALANQVMIGINSSLIHTQALVMLRYIQLILHLKLLFLRLLKDMIISPTITSSHRL